MANIFRPPIIQRITHRSHPVALLDWGSNLLTTTLAVVVIANPFFTTDWPNPTKAPTKGIDSSWIQNLQLTTFVAPEVNPFNQTEWPLVKGMASYRYDAPSNLLVSTLAVLPLAVRPMRSKNWHRTR